MNGLVTVLISAALFVLLGFAWYGLQASAGCGHCDEKSTPECADCPLAGGRKEND
jgi:hypothetical protein